jgi:hypothetical protein
MDLNVTVASLCFSVTMRAVWCACCMLIVICNRIQCFVLPALQPRFSNLILSASIDALRVRAPEVCEVKGYVLPGEEGKCSVPRLPPLRNRYMFVKSCFLDIFQVAWKYFQSHSIWSTLANKQRHALYD